MFVPFRRYNQYLFDTPFYVAIVTFVRLHLLDQIHPTGEPKRTYSTLPLLEVIGTNCELSGYLVVLKLCLDTFFSFKLYHLFTYSHRISVQVFVILLIFGHISIINSLRQSFGDFCFGRNFIITTSTTSFRLGRFATLQRPCHFSSSSSSACASSYSSSFYRTTTVSLPPIDDGQGRQKSTLNKSSKIVSPSTTQVYC